mmetsp:Transcript_408/g.504  ORF Transcript_408/g.504 Transcript_408/m.504 type:complete len:267 (+) Transcript_408:161-961(+)
MEENVPRGSILVLFDYDWSLINTNSDTFVVEVLANDLKQYFKLYRNEGMGWTSLMDRQMQNLHERGITPSDIEDCIANVPVQEGMLEAIQLAARYGAVLHIISDANEVFIQSFLKRHGLEDLFAGVHTNIARFSEEGRLSVQPYHHNDFCSMCPSNMCKGSIVRSILDEAQMEFSKIIYIGDGGGDYCPATLLRNGDVLLARASNEKDFGLIKMIRGDLGVDSSKTGENDQNGSESNASVIKADIVEWDLGSEVLNTFETIFCSHT